MDDSSIVDLFLLRDETAIARTQEAYGGRLRALAYGIVRDRQTAEECENDTYWKAWNSIPPDEPRHYLYAFLARIARNLSLNRCRDRKRLKRVAHLEKLSSEMAECIPAPGGVEKELDDRFLSETLNRYLAQLDEGKRDIFVRRYWYLDSVSDIARRFGLSQSQVKTTLYRCRRGLREQLAKEENAL